MQMEPNESKICIPGQRLCAADKENVAGQGTYEQLGYIYSKFAGILKIIKQAKTSSIEVHIMTDQSMVPAPGDIVTAMVTIVNQRFCKCVIKCIGDIVLSRMYKGIIRKEDVRATEKDKIDMYKSFKSGDIIMAKVLPMTDAHTYQLSTAENELGVVIAHSEQGAALVPVSWTEMQCPKTLLKECRKVAKIVPEVTFSDK